MFMRIIDFGEFSFEKDGKKYKYFQLVVQSSKGFEVKKVSPKFYDKLNNGDLGDFEIEGFLYDEFQRVAGVI